MSGDWVEGEGRGPGGGEDDVDAAADRLCGQRARVPLLERRHQPRRRRTLQSDGCVIVERSPHSPCQKMAKIIKKTRGSCQ